MMKGFDAQSDLSLHWVQKSNYWICHTGALTDGKMPETKQFDANSMQIRL